MLFEIKFYQQKKQTSGRELKRKIGPERRVFNEKWSSSDHSWSFIKNYKLFLYIFGPLRAFDILRGLWIKKFGDCFNGCIFSYNIIFNFLPLPVSILLLFTIMLLIYSIFFLDINIILLFLLIIILFLFRNIWFHLYGYYQG